MNNLYLSFPQWQGAGENEELFVGANALTDGLANHFYFERVPVVSPHKIGQKENIKGFEGIHQQLLAAREIIQQKQPDHIFTIGGDCGVELAPIDYLNSKYNSEIAVLWIDVHADLNTPESSPSKEFHGMPLRTLLGHGNQQIMSHLAKPLYSHQVYLLGVREYDEAEKVYIDSEGIKSFDVVDLCKNIGHIIRDIQKSGFEKVYVHVDLDILDPKGFSSVKCPTAGGMSVQQLNSSLLELSQSLDIIGGSVVEYTHVNVSDLKMACKIAQSVFIQA